MQPQLKKTLWIVVPSILLLVVVLAFALIYSINDTSSTAPGNASQAADNILRFPDHDFAFVPPDAPWQRSEPDKIAKGAVIAYVRQSPTVLFVATADKLPPNATATLEEIAKQIVGGIQNSFPNGNLQWVQQPTGKALNGIPGVIMVNRADANNVRTTYVHWAGIQRGKAYHLLAWGAATDEQTILSEAENMFGRFHPLDHFPANQPAGAVQQFTSTRYQYIMRFNDPNWRPWQDVAAQVPYAELGVMNGSDAVLVTSALNIGDIPADFDALLTSFARVTSIPLTPNNVSRLRSNTAEGAAVVFSVVQAGVQFDHFVELVRSKSTLFIGHGWTSNKQKFELIKDQLINNLNFGNSPPAPDAKMTPAEERVCGMLLNELGITYVRVNRPAQAIAILERAQQILPKEPTVVDNLAAAHMANGQPRNAKVIINAAMQQLPDQPPLKLRAAQIDVELGDVTAAKERFADVFSKPEYRNDLALSQYVRFLQKEGSLDNALSVLEKYRGGRDDSRSLNILYAMLIGDKGDHAKAATMLEQLRKTPTTAPTTMASAGPATAPTTMASEIDSDLLIALGQEYNALGRFDEAMDIATDLIKHGIEPAETYLIQAGALNGTKKYAEAKTAIENALRRNVASRECFDLFRTISENLGQNTKTLYTVPIEAALIPAEVFDGIPAEPTSPSLAEAMGAHYVARVGAVAFEAGKEFRATEHQRLKASTRQGSDRLNVFEFRFDPSTETIFVNKAEVKDGSGKVVSTVKPEDVFVTDPPADDRSYQRKVLKVAVSGMAPQNTLDLVVTRKQITPSPTMRLTRYFMSTPMLVQRAAFVVQTADTSRIAENASSGIEKKTYGTAVCWQMDNPPLFRGEPIQPEPSTYVPVVTVADSKPTWKDVGDDYLTTLKAIWPEDSEVRALASRLTMGLAGEQEKIDAIVGHVQKEYSYKASEFVQSARVPHKPAEIIRDKSGDAKDQAFLLFQLLRAAGFEARLALVSRGDRVEPQMATLDQFDHVVVSLPGADGSPAPRFLDVTEKDTKVMSPPETLVGSKALVLQPNASDLVPVGELPADASSISSKRQMTLENNGGVKVQETLQISGPAAALWRAPMKQFKPDEQRQVVKDALARVGINTDITELKITRLDDARQPLVLELTYIVGNRFGQAQNGAVVGSLPATWERHWLFPPQLTQRLSPFILRAPIKVETEFTLRLPEKVRLANPPAEGKVETKFGSLQSTFDVTKPGEVSGKSVIHANAGRYEKEAYQEFLESREKLLKASEPMMALQAAQ